jgi:hypothetical protein
VHLRAQVVDGGLGDRGHTGSLRRTAAIVEGLSKC